MIRASSHTRAQNTINHLHYTIQDGSGNTELESIPADTGRSAGSTTMLFYPLTRDETAKHCGRESSGRAVDPSPYPVFL